MNIYNIPIKMLLLVRSLSKDSEAWSSQGYRYTLVAVDLFSKFLEAWPLKEKDTTSVIDGLENACFNRHGLPDLLLSDQENAVDGQKMRDMCRRYGIRKIHSSAYHPQGDGQSERSIQSFKTLLRCILEDRHIIQQIGPTCSKKRRLS